MNYLQFKLSALLKMWIFPALLGMSFWISGNFLCTETVKKVSIVLSVIFGVILTSPLIGIFSDYRPALGKRPIPNWVLWYISLPGAFFLFTYPLYLFFTIAAPSIYTQHLGVSTTEEVSISNRFISGKRIDHHFLVFHQYSNSIRVTPIKYNEFKINSIAYIKGIKSELGIYVTNIETNKTLQRTNR